jgi:uncharacterized protein with von Willebrand factor type A (vWA) domain
MTIEEAQAHGTSNTDAKLAEFFMGVEAAANARLRAVNPVDPADWERKHVTQFDNGEPTASVTALRDIDELEELRNGHD